MVDGPGAKIPVRLASRFEYGESLATGVQRGRRLAVLPFPGEISL
jgi:hypothetical protein